MKNQIHLLLTISICLIIATGCISSQNKTEEMGTLKGRIEIGPICPVERDPPDPNCQLTKEMLQNWPIAIYSADKKTKIRTINIENINPPEFTEKLPIGTYIIDYEKQQRRIGLQTLPQTLTILTDQITNININIDTGIR